MLIRFNCAQHQPPGRWLENFPILSGDVGSHVESELLGPVTGDNYFFRFASQLRMTETGWIGAFRIGALIRNRWPEESTS